MSKRLKVEMDGCNGPCSLIIEANDVIDWLLAHQNNSFFTACWTIVQELVGKEVCKCVISIQEVTL